MKMKMHGKQWQWWVACGVMLLVLCGCAGASNPEQIPTGSYFSNSGTGSDQLKLSGSDYVLVIGTASVLQGNYTSTDREVTFSTDSLSARCAGTRTNALYRWTFKDNLLTLETVEDDCEYRAQVFAQTWGKR